jgi:hypothetical protein
MAGKMEQVGGNKKQVNNITTKHINLNNMTPQEIKDDISVNSRIGHITNKEKLKTK